MSAVMPLDALPQNQEMHSCEVWAQYVAGLGLPWNLQNLLYWNPRTFEDRPHMGAQFQWLAWTLILRHPLAWEISHHSVQQLHDWQPPLKRRCSLPPPFLSKWFLDMRDEMDGRQKRIYGWGEQIFLGSLERVQGDGSLVWVWESLFVLEKNQSEVHLHSDSLHLLYLCFGV